jgi:DinB superfamily
MNKQQLYNLLLANHTAFINIIAAMDEATFNKQVADKWTPAQQAKHIHQSVAPLNNALRLPFFAIGMMFGKANRASKTYEELVAKYKSKLAAGGRATGRFVPKEIDFTEKEKLIKQLQKDIELLCKLTLAANETALDKYILPHPLLGKLTLREMFYFTAYHVQHHQQLVAYIVNTPTPKN